MKILITGGAGFIGSHVVSCIAKTGISLVVLKRTTTSLWRLEDGRMPVSFVDCNSIKDIASIFKTGHFDGVIHLSAKYVKSHNGTEDVHEMLESNIVFPSVLLEHAIANNTAFFVNTGTCFEYKRTDGKTSEESPQSPLNYYAATKLAFEKILEYHSNQKSIKALTLRLFYPYGEKDNPKLIQLIINSLLKDDQLILSKGEQELDYTYVADIAQAFLKAVHFITSAKFKNYEIFNIGTGVVTSVREIVSVLQRISGKMGKISFEKSYVNNEIMHMMADNRKARRLLGWMPDFSLEKGLSQTYNYYVKSLKKT